ncbi:hypothetical protein [Mycolicibacter sinensis]
MKEETPAGQAGASKGDDTNGSSRNTNCANDDGTPRAGSGEAASVQQWWQNLRPDRQHQASTPTPPTDDDAKTGFSFAEWAAGGNGKQGTRPPAGPYTPPTPPAGADRYATAALADECAAVAATTEGSRNHRLNTAAFNLGQLVGAGALDRAVVEDALRAAARAAGLTDHEVGPTITSGLNAGTAQPRTIPAPAVVDLGDTDVGNLGAAGDDDGGDGQRPRYGDVAALLDGGLPDPPAPVVLHRTDGVAIFYQGKRNELYGDPEAGKTMIALAAMAEQLNDGGRGLFLDLDNNGLTETVQRLLMLGADPTVLRDPDRFRYIEPDDAAELGAAITDCAGWATIALIDCIGELIPMFGGKSNDGDDYTWIMRGTAGRLEAAGACTIVLDHLAKNTDSRQYGAGGTMAKRRAVSGASIECRNQRPFVPGHGGASELWINKDRPGGLRQHCPIEPGKRRQYAGLFELGEPDDDGTTDWRISTDPPAAATATSIDPVVERHYTAAAALAGTTTGATVAAVATNANGLPPGTPPTRSEKETARRALEKLQFAHRLVLVDGASPKQWELPE